VGLLHGLTALLQMSKAAVHLSNVNSNLTLCRLGTVKSMHLYSNVYACLASTFSA
jgi:hypothetical protein